MRAIPSIVLFACACAGKTDPSALFAAHLDAGGTLVEAQSEAWAQSPMTAAQASQAVERAMAQHLADLREDRAAELDAGVLVHDDYELRLWHTTYGDAPDGQRSLYISLHGGGGTTAEVNDQQWRNQQGLYEPDEGVYVAPRAPTNEWNLWHRPEMDVFIDRLIEDMVALEGVDPNRVYLTGYSAGGDGAYQLAWHLADRFAAANPNAGHPNDSSPVSMRNLPITIHVGGDDTAYNRNTVAADWGEQLAGLQLDDGEGGYEHDVQVHPGLPHWMNGEETVAMEWMAQFDRQTSPERVVWQVRGDRSGPRFYWLGLAEPSVHSGVQIEAEILTNGISVLTTEPVDGLRIWVDDALIGLDAPLQITVNGEERFNDVVPRTVDAVIRSLTEPGAAFLPRSGFVDVP